MPGLLLPQMTPTLLFPVMLKRKLKVRRREEAAQVPEVRSSWLQLQREEEEVRWSSQAEGGGGATARGQTGDASGKTPERGRGREREDSGAGCSRHPPPRTSGMWTLVSQAPPIYAENSRLLPDGCRPPLPTPPGPISSLMLLPTEVIWGGGPPGGGACSSPKQEPCVGPSLLFGQGLWASSQ